MPPELVVVLLDVDDAVECQLTGSLKIECERLGIALVTCAAGSPASDIDDVVAMERDNSYRRVAMSMN